MTAIEAKLGICFPRTLAGWKVWWRLARHRCPADGARLRSNWPYDFDGYCFKCDGVGMIPGRAIGPINSLRENYRAVTEKASKE